MPWKKKKIGLPCFPQQNQVSKQASLNHNYIKEKEMKKCSRAEQTIPGLFCCLAHCSCPTLRHPGYHQWTLQSCNINSFCPLQTKKKIGFIIKYSASLFFFFSGGVNKDKLLFQYYMKSLRQYFLTFMCWCITQSNTKVEGSVSDVMLCQCWQMCWQSTSGVTGLWLSTSNHNVSLVGRTPDSPLCCLL